MTLAHTVLHWVAMNPKKYYKDGQLYGLVGTIDGDDGYKYVFVMAHHVEARFTTSMIKDIISLYRRTKVCVLVDTESKKAMLAKALDRYTDRIEHRDGLMYVYSK